MLVIPLRGHQYSLKPHFNYKMRGLVVELADAMRFTNTTHKNAGDYLNSHDICVLWGADANDLDLSKLNFTHGDWTCYVQTTSMETWAKFKMDGLANNHMLPATPEIQDLIRDVRIGDQIEFEGQLVDYNIDGGPFRTTSTIRSDTGNGACEIVYVTSFKFLKRHHASFYALARLFEYLTVLSLIILGAALFIAPYARKLFADGRLR